MVFEPFLFIWVFIIMTLQVIAKYDHMYNTHFLWKCGHTRKKKRRFTCDHTWKVCVIQSYLFWITYDVNNMNTQIKEKVLARLGRLTAPKGARPRSFHHEATLHGEKSPTTFPLTLWTSVKKDIPSSYFN